MTARQLTMFERAATLEHKTQFCDDGAYLQTYVRAHMTDNALREIDRLIWVYECYLAEFDGWCGDCGVPDLPGGYDEDDIANVISMLNTLPPLICAGDFVEADIRISREMFRRTDEDKTLAYLHATGRAVGHKPTTQIDLPQTAEGNGK